MPVSSTDAPYRETAEQLEFHARARALAVEMQAASLFAFGSARKFPVGLIAHVTNAIGLSEEQFDKGSDPLGYEIFKAACRAGRRVLRT
jgi:uridine phosphorylase